MKTDLPQANNPCYNNEFKWFDDLENSLKIQVRSGAMGARRIRRDQRQYDMKMSRINNGHVKVA